jgi:hypothetical protein
MQKTIMIIIGVIISTIVAAIILYRVLDFVANN